LPPIPLIRIAGPRPVYRPMRRPPFMTGRRVFPGGEGVTRWAEAAADEIDATAQYVRTHDAPQMLADFKQLVRRNPGAWVVGAAVVGVLMGRGFRK